MLGKLRAPKGSDSPLYIADPEDNPWSNAGLCSAMSEPLSPEPLRTRTPLYILRASKTTSRDSFGIERITYLTELLRMRRSPVTLRSILFF